MQPQYPTQYPIQYPPAPAPAQPQYAPQYPAQYAQLAYTPPAAPTIPLPTGTLDSFYDQPSGGAPSLKFMDANRNPQIGKSYAGIVARPITNADVRAQTDDGGRPVTFRDGRPKFVLVVPLLIQPSAEHPEGQAGWWVKGQARDELARAMGEAGAPAGPPEAGAGIRVTLTGTRPIPGRNPQYLFRVEYTRPQGTPPVAQVQSAPPAPPPVDPGGQTVNPIQYPPAPAPAQPQYAPQVTPPATPAAVQTPATPEGFSAEQAALFAKLTGQPTQS